MNTSEVSQKSRAACRSAVAIKGEVYACDVDSSHDIHANQAAGVVWAAGVAWSGDDRAELDA